ncbi:hypothetical protein LOTGIDRAFT_167627 [Lottia gigantea]|uniref:Uncharacterized protein n=1 Tax=Lottia gigantea TaxID=225164 RepID=V3ZY42_LOTGI|nr:hypothetical protein LOTGIDRAFT_167627 [Lottia gigantea]ESO85876.1 hypothetical protein LOTGIDRAFT_167627 [Lottia gigantea]
MEMCESPMTMIRLSSLTNPVDQAVTWVRIIRERSMPKDLANGQLIITSCSLTNVSVKTVELCEEETRSSVVVSKVMSKRTELHYKNRHCMLCNGEDEDDIVYWSTMVGTNNRRQRPNSGQDIVELFNNPVMIIPPTNSREIICFPNMISSCVPSATQEEQRFCRENALSPIRYTNSMYKNKFCLNCNVIIESTESCFTAVRNDIFYGIQAQSYSFSMVFNWKQNRESFVILNSKMSLVKDLSCTFDADQNLKECKVRNCVGTLPVVNNTCQLISYTQYFEYLDTNLAFNLTGSISTKRYRVACYEWCSIPKKIKDLSYYRTFTGGGASRHSGTNSGQIHTMGVKLSRLKSLKCGNSIPYDEISVTDPKSHFCGNHFKSVITLKE